jgi:hypothetical protein
MFGLFCSVQFNSIQFLNNQEGIVPQMRRPGLNVSTTPLRQWGFRQCLPFSWTTLRGKHCRHHIAVMGVVYTFGQMPVPDLYVFTLKFLAYIKKDKNMKKKNPPQKEKKLPLFYATFQCGRYNVFKFYFFLPTKS